MEEQNKKKKVIYWIFAIIVLIGVVYIVMSFFDVPKDMAGRTFSGIIQSIEISGDYKVITMTTPTLSIIKNIPRKALLEVKVTDDTSLSRDKEKDHEIYVKELETYQKAVDEQNAVGVQTSQEEKLTPPISIEHIVITADELVTGDFITVTSKEDARQNDKVTAVSVRVNEKTTLPNFIEEGSVLSAPINGVVGWVGVQENSSFAVDNPLNGKRIAVMFDKDTKFIKQENKTKEEFEKEFSAFQKLSDAERASAKVPIPFREIEVTSVQVGDTVAIEGTENVNGVIKAKLVKIMIQAKEVGK